MTWSWNDFGVVAISVFRLAALFELSLGRACLIALAVVALPVTIAAGCLFAVKF